MVHEDEVVQVVNSIWNSILGLEVTVESAGSARERLEGERTLTACVHVTGDFEGATLVFCTARLAREFAAIMFETPADALSVEDVQDALGELANMIAGNIKPLLEGSSRLSLPSVVEGLDYRLIVPGSRALSQVGLQCQGEPLHVTIVQREGAS